MVNIVAIDCEMVTTETGLELARISVVGYDYNLIMDEYVVPDLPILDYNTKKFLILLLFEIYFRFSGITKEHLADVKTKLIDIQHSLA